MLGLSGIEKSYGEAPVLRGVSFEVHRGEVHALLGENGAGKSTLMRIVLGLETLGAGSLTLDGKVYAPRSARDARLAGVVMVPQERTLCDHLSVADNMVLGIEPTRRGILDKAKARELVRDALRLVTGEDARIPLDARASDLSVADQQLVEIARALAQAGGDGDGARSNREARLLVLDEPTSSLGHDDADRLFSRVRALKESGLAIILVTHFLGDVRAHADRYTVLRDGKVQGEGDPRTTSPQRIVHEMLGRELEAAIAPAAARADRDAVSPSDEQPAAPVLLEVNDLAGARRPQRASFVLRRGEILGVAGLVGSGRTELLRMVLGLDRPKRGTITRHAPRGVGLLSEDRGGEGLMLRRSIGDNVTLSSRGPLLVRPRSVREEGALWIRELAIRARDADQPTGELSGGNQQKVQIARLLREDYDVLLVDEPTRGIDVASKAQVLALLRELATKGKGIVLVSSQLDELVATCDRIAVLRNGLLGEARPALECTEESLLLEAAS